MNTKFLLKFFILLREIGYEYKKMRNDYIFSLERKQSIGVYLFFFFVGFESFQVWRFKVEGS